MWLELFDEILEFCLMIGVAVIYYRQGKLKAQLNIEKMIRQLASDRPVEVNIVNRDDPGGL